MIAAVAGWWEASFERPPDIHDGIIRPSEEPGIGVHLRAAAATPRGELTATRPWQAGGQPCTEAVIGFIQNGSLRLGSDPRCGSRPLVAMRRRCV